MARLWLRLAAGLVGLLGLAYGAVWFVPPLHTLAIETVVTSGHAYLAHWIATPREFSAASARWRDTPDVSVISPSLSPSEASGLSVRPIQGSTFRGWVLLVDNPSWVHVVITAHLGRVGAQVRQFARDAGALAAVNGGGFQDPAGNGTGGLPVGVTASYGQIRQDPDLTGDYVIGLDGRGGLDVGKWTRAQALALGIRDAVSFKPLLVVRGAPQITSGDGGWGVGPRTAIGQRADGAIIFVVIDGRQPSSLGATLRQVQNIMLREGAITAVNLDGGSSSTLWYRGRTLNHPCCSPNGQRYIATAFVVKR